MRSILDELLKDLSELRTLVISIPSVNSTLALHHDQIVRQYVTVRRRFDYAAFVVALYASFEGFVESLTSSYAQHLSSMVPYLKLPSALTKKHVEKSAEMLLRGRLGIGRYEHIQPIDVIKNLFDCLAGNDPYTLTEAAIIAHDLNLRYDEVNKLFNHVGIENILEKAGHESAMKHWHETQIGNELAPGDSVPPAILQQRLDGLIERRNQVAHSGGTPVDLFGVDDMQGALSFFEALACSIFSLAISGYLHQRYVSSSLLQPIDVERRLQKGGVIIVKPPSQRLYVGQPIFATTSGIAVKWGRISSLRIDEVEFDEIGPKEDIDSIGIGINFRCSRSAKIFALDQEDDVVWPPR